MGYLFISIYGIPKGNKLEDIKGIHIESAVALIAISLAPCR